MKHRSRLITLAALPLIAGCTVGPAYSPPVVESVPDWPSDLAPRVASEENVIAEWWTRFGDPELNELIRTAVRANHDLRIAEARVAEARALRGIARAAGLPRVDASAAAFARLESRSELPDPSADRDGEWYEAGFDASWEIDVFGGVRRSVEAATADLRVSEEHRRAVLVSVVAEVARTYVELRRAEAQLDIARRSEALQVDTLALVGALRQAGRATDVEHSQAAERLATVAASIPVFEFEARRARHRIEVLVGGWPAATPAVASRTQQPAPPYRVPIGLPGDILRRRPDIREAERRLEASTARIGVATASLYPRFFLTGAAGIRSASASDALDPSQGFWRLGPTMSWPVLEFGRLRRDIEVHGARAEADRIRYEQAIRVAMEEAFTSLVGFGKEQHRLDMLLDAETHSRSAAESALDRYRAGLEPFLVVLDTQRSQLESEDRVAISRSELATRFIALYKALGGGWETDHSSLPIVRTEIESKDDP